MSEDTRTIEEVRYNAAALQDGFDVAARLFSSLRDLLADGHVEDAVDLAKANRLAWEQEDDDAIDSTEAQIRLLADIRCH